MWIIFTLLAIIMGLATIGLLIAAAVLNAAWMIVAAIGAGLLTWLFAYTADNTEMF